MAGLVWDMTGVGLGRVACVTWLVWGALGTGLDWADGSTMLDWVTGGVWLSWGATTAWLWGVAGVVGLD